MLITDNPDAEEIEPEFKYVATMHGNEIASLPISIYFIDYLLNNYNAKRRVRRLINRTAVWVVPLMNPDGYIAGTRANANGIDLNRNFPTWPEQFSGTLFDGAPLNTAGREPETQHVMEWTAANSFVLSANFHTGARLVNYPYDDDDKGSFVDAPSPDDLLFEDISLRYSTPNTPMYTNPVPYFPGGIVNGSLWYEIVGGMQDWNYRYAGCNEVTIELTPQSPPASGLPALWNDNRESMFAYAEAVHVGVRGLVRDKLTGEPLYAQIKVQGNPQRVYTDPDVGDYYRMLLPGTYRLRYSAPGYRTKSRDVTVTDGRAVRVNVRLKPAPG
jgi:carboxypeptidase D